MEVVEEEEVEDGAPPIMLFIKDERRGKLFTTSDVCVC